MGEVVYLERVRRQRSIAPSNTLTPVTSHDAKLLARWLCQALAMTAEQGPVALDSVVSRTGMPKADAMVAATYAHVRGWVSYRDDGVELTQAGRAIAEDGPDTAGGDKRSA